MASLQLPPASRLFLELLAARLEIKLLCREVAELKARLGDANLMISRMPMRYEKRLRTLARRAGRCCIHLTKLYCVSCEVRGADAEWTGSDAELQELVTFMGRSLRYLEDPPPAGVCGLHGCGGKLFCEQCYADAMTRMQPSGVVWSPEEHARYTELLKKIRMNGTSSLLGSDLLA